MARVAVGAVLRGGAGQHLTQQGVSTDPQSAHKEVVPDGPRCWELCRCNPKSQATVFGPYAVESTGETQRSTQVCEV